MFWTLLHNQIVHGVIVGALGAAVADYDAFRKLHDWHDIANFGWSVASFRWFQGALFGGLTAAGYGVIA